MHKLTSRDLIPRFAVFQCTASAPDDHSCSGPEYAGRTLCIGWLGLVVEITLAARNDDA